MKNLRYIILLLVAVSMSSCLTTLLTLETKPVQPTTTVVVTKPVVQNVIVPNVHHADYLDLRAVAAAFSQSRSVQEFEQILNSQAYMINNIDLNGDGFIDYLRVRETLSGYKHQFAIQAVLAANWIETVATVEVLCSSSSVDYIKVLGSNKIYGPNYVYQPIFKGKVPMFAHIHGSNYQAWTSPYDWNKYPTYYNKPKPVSKEHYVKYVDTYITHNRYTEEPKHNDQPSRQPSTQRPSTKPADQPSRQPSTQRPTTQPSRQQTTTTTRVNSTTGRVANHRVESTTTSDNGTTTHTTTTTRVNNNGSTTSRTTTTTTPSRTAQSAASSMSSRSR